MARTARTGLRKSLEFAGFCAGLLLLLELSARVFLFGWSGLIPDRINSVHGMLLTGFTKPSVEARLGYELEPDVDGYFKLVPFRTNSRGLRDAEYSIRKPANTFRVVVVGSSFALPAGVAIEDAFHSQLEEQLSRELAPVRFEFINFAVGMYSPEQVLAMLELRALDYQPDLVLVTATRLSMPALPYAPGASPAKPVPRLAPDVVWGVRPSYPILRSFLVPLIRARTGGDTVLREGAPGLLEKLYIDLVGGSGSPEESARMRPQNSRRSSASVLERLAAIGEREKVPIVLARLDIEQTEESDVDRDVRERSRALGMHYLDTREAFRARRARDFWIYELDPHPNAEAHQIFAEDLASFLRDNGLVPERAPS
jgi:hypothetical protein